ncbi:MAG: ribulose-phosphate 3-epimerase [Gaiellales bacterium]
MTWPADNLVLPSILASDYGAFRAQVQELLDAGARAFHCDMMDGHFVPPITFGSGVIASIADPVHEVGGVLDVHLMIERPERQLEELAKAGADSVTVHVETCPHLHRVLAQIHELGMRAGVTMNPSTPTAAISDAIRDADHVLCMSVDPGWGGQVFIEQSYARLRELRSRLLPGMGLEVDGGVGPKNAGACVEAGANLVVAGSAIYGQASPGDAYRAIVAAAGFR